MSSWSSLPKVLHEQKVKDFRDKSKYIRDCFLFPARELTLKDHIESIFGDDDGYLPFQNSIEPEKFKYNALLTQIPFSDYNKKFKKLNIVKSFSRVIFEDDVENNENFNSLARNKELIMAPVTFIGRRRLSKNARKLYSIVVDLDGVIIENLDKLFGKFIIDALPTPNNIINSGNGVHLYYNLETPIDIWNTEQQDTIRKFLHKFNEEFFIPNVTTWKDKLAASKLSAIQGYRTIGSLTKFGEVVRGWSIREEKFSLEELNKYTNNFLTNRELAFLYGQETITTVKYSSDNVKPWIVNSKFYEYYKREIRNVEVITGNRYWKLANLAIVAKKCNIPYVTLLEDMDSLYNFLLENSTIDSFDRNEVVQGALLFYNEDYRTTTSRSIENKTGIRFNRVKRNYRTRKEHLELARQNRKGSRAKEENKRTYKKREKTSDLANRILKDNKGLSHKELAEKYSCSQAFINKVLGKQNKVSKSEKIKRSIIKILLTEKRLTQSELSKKSGVSRPVLSKMWKQIIQFMDNLEKQKSLITLEKFSETIKEYVYENEELGKKIFYSTFDNLSRPSP